MKITNVKSLQFSLIPIAEESGLSINDEIIAINGIQINKDFTEWSTYFKDEEIVVSVKRALGVIERIALKANDTIYFKKYSILKTDDFPKNFKAWSE